MKIWFKVGVDIELTADEYRILTSKNISNEVKTPFFTDLLKRAELRGETYAPELDGLDNEYVNENDGFTEIAFLF